MKKIKLVTIFTILLLITFISLELIFNKNEDKHYRENNNIEYKEGVTKPEKPNVNDIPTSNQNGYVYVKCESYPNANPRYNSTRTHAGFMSLKNSSSGWKFGEVYENDGRFGDDVPASSYPWLCDLIINKDWYLDRWNANYSSKEGTHYLADSATEVKTTFVSDGSEWYFFTDDYPLVVWTTHNVTKTNYKVVREYYIDNQLVATVTGGLKEGIVGEIINLKELAEYNNSNWKNYTIDGNKIEFVLDGSSDETITLDEDDNKNIIVLKYKNKFNLSISANQNYAYVGEEIRYTIKIRNNGSSTASLNFSDSLDNNLSFNRVNGGGKYDKENHTITWENVMVPSNESKEFILWVYADKKGEITNEVIAYSDNYKIRAFTTITVEERMGDNKDSDKDSEETKKPEDSEETKKTENQENSNDDKDPEESIQDNPITGDTIIITIIISLISLITYIFLIKKRKTIK